MATPSQTTPSPKQQQALARLEQEAEQAVKDCGLDLVAASRSQKGRGKRGRPPGSFKTGAAVAGVRKSRADATAAGKLRRELKALKDSPAYSKTTARRELQNRRDSREEPGEGRCGDKTGRVLEPQAGRADSSQAGRQPLGTVQARQQERRKEDSQSRPGLGQEGLVPPSVAADSSVGTA